MLLPKVTEDPEIRLLVRREHPKGHLLLQLPCNPPRGRNPHGIGVQQHLHQQLRMIGWGTTRHAAIGGKDGGKIQFLHQVRQKLRQVVVRQPVAWGRRQQPQLFGIIGAKHPSRHHAASSLITM